MNKDQEDKFSSFEPIELVLRDNEALWRNSPGIVAAHNTFVAGWEAIDPDARKQLTGSTSATITKSGQRSTLEALTLLTSGNIQAYGMATSNAALEHDMEFTPSGLEKMRDNVLLITAGLVRDTATANAPALADYHTGPEEIRSLDEAIKDFSTSIGAPRRSIVAKKTATTNIRETLAQCERQLAIIDRLIQNFRKDYPEFVADYEAARKVIPLGHRRHKVADTTGA